MASTQSKKTRKGLAIGLAVVGVAGLSLAAASQLSLTSAAKFQAGSVTINADCQGTTAIPVTFGAPTLNTTSGVYSAASVDFGSIAVTGTPNCNGLKYKVAIQTSTGGTWTDITPTGSPTVTAATLSVAIPSGTTASNITGVSLTIFS